MESMEECKELRSRSFLDLDARSFKYQNIISLEIAWPIKLIFYVERSWVVALKFCLQYLGHMTKMATVPIYGKTLLQKSSSPEPVSGSTRNLVCSTGDYSPS